MADNQSQPDATGYDLVPVDHDPFSLQADAITALPRGDSAPASEPSAPAVEAAPAPKSSSPPMLSDEDVALAQINKDAGTNYSGKQGGLMQTIPELYGALTTPEGREKIISNISSFEHAAEPYVSPGQFIGRAIGSGKVFTPEGREQIAEQASVAPKAILANAENQVEAIGKAESGQLTPDQEAELGAGIGLQMVTGGLGTAEAGAVGMAGGKLRQPALKAVEKAKAETPPEAAAIATGAPPAAPNLESKPISAGKYPSWPEGEGPTMAFRVPDSTGEASPFDEAHALSSIQKDVAEKVMADNAGTGLQFPPEDAADRLRLKLSREQKAAAKGADVPGGPNNDRTVVRAPVDENGNKTKPDFVTGNITPEDWIARQEALMTPQEIKDASGWYQQVHGEFLKQTNGDEAMATKLQRAWLVAQQNIGVPEAMNNVLLQAEQTARGVPNEKMIAGGMPYPTQAARAVIQDRPIQAGVAEKIADFVDSAEGKNVRSWMGNHPAGGEPFVVDVHTARDTGLVDPILKNHLTRLGYNPKDIKKLDTDFGGGGIGSTQYENRANFGRELTDYLNKKNWQGRSDWTPAEAQAVGWMGMTRLTAGSSEDVLTGFARNMRNISMGVAPGEGSPWSGKFGDRFNALPMNERHALTENVSQEAIDHASRLAGINVKDIVHGTGIWNKAPNPSTVAQTFSTQNGSEIAANALGHLLNQTEVWSNKVKPLTKNPKSFAVDLVAHGENALNTDEGVLDLWRKITEADPMKGTKSPLFVGYQPIRTRDGMPGIRVLVDRGGEKTAEALKGAIEGPLKDAIQSSPGDFTSELHEAEITKARNDWKENPNGQAYMDRLGELLGRNPAAELAAIRQKLEAKLAAGIEQAERRAKASAAIRQTRGFGLSDEAGLPGTYRRANNQGIGDLGGIAYTPTPQLEAAWNKAGISTPTYVELPSRKSNIFKQAIGEAKAASPHGAAVTVYPDYSGMRTFLTPDRKAGFALNGDDIISVFRHPDATTKNTVASMLHLAVKEGGRRLDAFDTQLPYLYGQSGFRAVSRTKFNPEYQPDGWSYDTFSRYNKGKPDVVFMAYDPKFEGGYRRGDGVMKGDYDSAAEAQQKAVADIRGSGGNQGAPVLPQRAAAKGITLGSGQTSGEAAPRFFSAVENAVANAKTNSAPASQWLGMLKNTPGVKPEEMDWLGLNDWLASQKGNVTKQQIADYVRGNKVDLQEKMSGSPPGNPRFLPRYSEYTLPGGENYREMLLTLPQKEGTTFDSGHWDEPNVLAHVRMNDRNVPIEYTSEEKAALQAHEDAQPLLNENRKQQNQIALEIQKTAKPLEAVRRTQILADNKAGKISNVEAMRRLENYESPPELKLLQDKLQNLRAEEDKIRNSLPPKPEPKFDKTLHLEEIQSDWHQAGRKRGYWPPAAEIERLEARRRELEVLGGRMRSEGKQIPPEMGREWADIMNRLRPETRDVDGLGRYQGVPDAPFKKSWLELAAKRMIREAAEKGYDRLSWTPGEAQALRYPDELRKTINSIEWHNKKSGKVDPSGAKQILVTAKNGDEIEFSIDNKGIVTNGPAKAKGEHLSDVIGKNMSNDILNKDEGNIEAKDFVMGAEGMKEFYDKMLPRVLEKIGKDYGVKVKDGLVEGNGDRQPKQPVKYIDLPQGLKDVAMKRGFPMFADGGAVDDPYADFRRSTNIEDDTGESTAQKLYDNFMLNVTGKKQNWISELSNMITGNAQAAPVIPDTTSDPLSAAAGYNSIPAPQRAHGGRVIASNINHSPSEAQKSAGNYAKEHISFQGLPITIENAKGSKRRGVGADGKAWESVLPAHYGYVKGTLGKDLDHIDVYIGPHTKSPRVYVIDQMEAKTKAFDEHKCMLGFGTERQAINTYCRAFSDGKGKDRIGKVTGMTMDQFRDWLENGNTKKPFQHVAPRKERVLHILNRHGIL